MMVLERDKTDPLTVGGENCQHPYWFEIKIYKVAMRKHGPVAIGRCMNCNRDIEFGWLGSHIIEG